MVKTNFILTVVVADFDLCKKNVKEERDFKSANLRLPNDRIVRWFLSSDEVIFIQFSVFCGLIYHNAWRQKSVYSLSENHLWLVEAISFQHLLQPMKVPSI